MSTSTKASSKSKSYSIQSLEDNDFPRAPLRRQVSLDEERPDDCQGHWQGPELVGEEEQKGIRLFRALLLQHLRLEELRPPPCWVALAKPDQRGWWMYWRDWRALDRAARKFRETKAQALLAARAEHIPLLSLDEVEFEDIMQEVCQACVHVEQRALVVLAFLCEVCSRAVRVGGWCRAADWAAKHVAQCATPWAIRHGGWSTVVDRAGGGRRDEATILAGAAVAALLAFWLFCRSRLRHAIL
ncbi:Apoptosis regulator BAX [Operophtera brumata]|uniref:Apoptosis regulator BAX n=1 Tax=Operophtera brumata TaxID=104452 RepID=A0A0L7LIJ4_OPEBR|nr:Apoptosis regulator BAX [Operophtera brumata]